MAYAALLSLTRTLENILFSGDGSQVVDEELQIKSLHQKLGLFISFLEETSQENSYSVEDLEERIRDAVYEAEDIIESHMSNFLLGSEASTEESKSFPVLEHRITDATYETKNTSFWNRARCLLCMCQTSKENNEEDLEKKNNEEGLEKRNNEEGLEKRNNEEDLEKKNNEERIQNIMEKLDSIWEEVEKMKDMNKIEDLQIENHLTRLAAPIEVKNTSKIGVNEIEEVEKMRPSNLSKSASANTSAPMVGLQDDMLQIKELLTGYSIYLETISIVGMGGIGKTTLARNIYNDSFVNRHFDIQAWTTVSQKYNVVALLVDLLKSTGAETNERDMEELKRKLYQSLKKRRYLIVMDDVWDTEFLKEFKNILPDDNTGSRIIMTSRSSEVANFQNYSSHIHRVNFLSPEQSWNLLCQKALGEETCSPGLEETGRNIAEKCKGLPLSLVVIGGVLYKGNKTLAHWKYVEVNMKSAEAGNYDELMEVLSWSYNNLPHHLKACFLYMAVYPEDYFIHVSHLIMLWLAEGFIKPIPPKSLEQVAKEYLEDLIARNLIIVCDQTYYGEIKSCTIHDLIRDLCTIKSREKMFLQVADNDHQDAIENERFLSIHRKEQFYFGHRYHPTVRSLLCFKHAYGLPRNFRLQLLRVFDACSISFVHFPTQITKLVNLRYLAFCLIGGGNIPASISNLCNLQTLIFMQKFDINRHFNLPSEILKLPRLRHLVVSGGPFFLSFPSDAPKGSLQQLSGLNNIRFTMETIENILDLKTLGIIYRHYEVTTNWSFYCLNNLVHLHQLENLKLHFNGFFSMWLPVNLSFPQKLNKLSLRGCGISWKQLSMIGSLPNLQVLKLKNVSFENSAWKPNEGEFSKLKFLLIYSSYISGLKHWEAEAIHFPSLECLTLWYCYGLNCIPCGIGEIPTLQDIVLFSCSKGVNDSANEIVEEQRDFGNESLKLHKGRRSWGICFFKNYDRRIV